MSRHEADLQRATPRRRGLVAATAFLACLVVAAGLVVATSNDAPAPPSKADGGHPHRDSSHDQGRRCPDFPNAATTVPTEAPDDIAWEVYHTVVLPTSERVGPHIVEGDVARCYAHTPTGALLAATQLTIRSSLAADWRPVVDQQVTGDGVKELRQELRRFEATGKSIRPGMMGQYTGFRFITYDARVAVIDLATRGPNGSLRAVATTVRWSTAADDWQLEVPVPESQTVDSLNGYDHWGGV